MNFKLKVRYEMKFPFNFLQILWYLLKKTTKRPTKCLTSEIRLLNQIQAGGQIAQLISYCSLKYITITKIAPFKKKFLKTE